MSIRTTYLAMPRFLSMILSLLLSALLSAALAAVSVLTTDFALNRVKSADGPGAGVLIILVALNVALPAFIACVTVLVNFHHPTSWRVPALAFVICLVFVRALGPFDLQFAPFMLGTAAIACICSCWMLRRREISSAKNVLEA